MTGDGLLELRRRTTLVPVLIRGELAIGAQLRATKLVYGRFRLDPNHDAVMRIGGEAPGGGPILSVGILVPRQQPVPATSDRRPAVPVVDASSERRAGKEMILQRFVSLPDAG